MRDTSRQRAERLAERFNMLPSVRRDDLARLPFYARALARELVFLFDDGRFDPKREELHAVVARIGGGAMAGERRLLKRHIDQLVAAGFLVREGTAYRIPGYRQMRETLGRGGHHNRVLYFVQRPSDDLIKIGIANDLEERLASLRKAFGPDLRVLGFLVVRDPEVDWHDRFDRHRIEGEWFAPAPELLGAIADVRGPR